MSGGVKRRAAVALAVGLLLAAVPTAQQVPKPETDPTVYVTKTGKKYQCTGRPGLLLAALNATCRPLH